MARATQEMADFRELFKATYETMFTGWQLRTLAEFLKTTVLKGSKKTISSSSISRLLSSKTFPSASVRATITQYFTGDLLKRTVGNEVAAVNFVLLTGA